ncbi:FAD-dependent oxidoreductase [Mycoplasmopsis felis]|uniref:FAD-dependent oxidoreductase n=1 Tax=Mycoplasmopsis felis TaxID=33923 RepID=UPI0021AECFB2|nr:FAD-dependent oxidoreductase [Mycoplasmopsis felis]UWV85449.1 FAD-dependent oxidoreductase [Mycoplasmopsis felis]
MNQKIIPAVRRLKFQIDKEKYSKIIKESLENHPNISLIEGVVEEVLVDENKKVIGIKLDNEEIIKTDVLVITTGTYMNSRILREMK